MSSMTALCARLWSSMACVATMRIHPMLSSLDTSQDQRNRSADRHFTCHLVSADRQFTPPGTIRLFEAEHIARNGALDRPRGVRAAGSESLEVPPYDKPLDLGPFLLEVQPHLGLELRS